MLGLRDHADHPKLSKALSRYRAFVRTVILILL